MSARFALDQSVLYGALEGQHVFLRAIVAIVERCDTVVWDDQWWTRCYDEMCRQAAAGSATALLLLRLLQPALAWQGKMEQQPSDPPPVADEAGIHREDLWLVRLAVAAGASVVAEDAPLLEALRAKGIPCVRPDDIAGE